MATLAGTSNVISFSVYMCPQTAERNASLNSQLVCLFALYNSRALARARADTTLIHSLVGLFVVFCNAWIDRTNRDRSTFPGRSMNEMARVYQVNERKNRVVRITVDDPRRQGNSKSMVESVIGRAGHMCFIDSPQVAWLISLALLPFMEETVPRRS